MRARRWTITLNNYTEAEKEAWNALGEEVKYLIYGEEVAPTTGCAHLQGYVEYTSTKSMAQVKEDFGDRVHLEVAKGTGRQNKAYCSKDGKVTEFGEMGSQGSRKDMRAIQEMIENGATDLEIAREHFGTWSRMRGAIQEYRRMLNPRRIVMKHSLQEFSAWKDIVFPEDEKVTIFWGESGIGKTSFCKALYPGALMVSHMDDLRHFKSDEHTAIIFDDMDFKHFPRNSQIHIVDSDDDRSIHCRYDCAFIPAGTRKLFTTNENGGNIFDLKDAAIKRRVKVRELGLRLR